METIDLGTTGRKTTRLGYGCSGLMGATGRKESMAMLEAAFDAGVRHFDVAPLDGGGEAESCLGDFLHRHRGYVTVTTKYGIAPSTNPGLMGFARSIAGPLAESLPGRKKAGSKPAEPATARNQKRTFVAEQAKGSLERSLKELRTDRIDVWLLQDVSADDLRDEAKDETLLRLMEDSVAAGTVGAFGVGSGRKKVETLAIKRPKFCGTMQFEWSVMDSQVRALHGFRIHHRALTDNFRALHSRLVEDKVRCAQWSDAVGANLADGSLLASLMLKSALVENPESVVLFSSKDPEHMQRNAKVAADAAMEAPARRLYSVVQAAAKGSRAIEAGG